MESGVEELNLNLSLEPSSLPEPEKVFICIYCDRKFDTSQALGGHQNAHKLERSIKRTREMAAATRTSTGSSHHKISSKSSKEGFIHREELGGFLRLEARNEEEEEDKNASDEIDLALKL